MEQPIMGPALYSKLELLARGMDRKEGGPYSPVGYGRVGFVGGRHNVEGLYESVFI